MAAIGDPARVEAAPAENSAEVSPEPADLAPSASRFKGPTPASMLRAATSSLGAARTAAPGVSAETLNKVERAGGRLATRSVALMDE